MWLLHSRLLYGSRSIVLSFTPARVTLLIQFSSWILHLICALTFTRPCILRKQLLGWKPRKERVGGGGGWGEVFGFLPRKEYGRVAYRSINIKSCRKYNLLPHCSPSGVRRLAGARRIKYIHRQTRRYAHTCTHTSVPGSYPVFQSWHVTPGGLAELHGPSAHRSFVYITLTKGEDQWPQRTMQHWHFPFSNHWYLFVCQWEALFLRWKALFVLYIHRL